jgi:hypothetical protein
MSQVNRRGEKAILTALHPILGCELEISATSLHLRPEEYLALVDFLCNAVFLSPHLVGQVSSLAKDLKLPEVTNYIGWMREADKNKSWKEAA